jgi:hypothetical protein
VGKFFKNLFFVAFGTIQLWWNKAVSLSNVVSVIKLPGDAGDLFGSFGMSYPTVLLVIIGLAGIYLFNREFWHGLFRQSFSRRWKMILGYSLLISGCAMGVAGLSLIAAGDNTPTKIAPAGSAPQQSIPGGMLSLEDAIHIANERLADLEHFGLLAIGARDNPDGFISGWANRLKSRVPIYTSDGSPISMGSKFTVRGGKVFVGDVGGLTVKRGELEPSIAQARLDFPPIPPGSNAIATDDSPDTEIVGNRAGAIHVRKGPRTKIYENDVWTGTQPARDSDSIYQAGIIVGHVFGGRRHPNDATRFTFVEITKSGQLNSSAPFQFQNYTMQMERVESRIGMMTSRPQDGVIYSGVVARITEK